MHRDDTHRSLKSEVIAKAGAAGAQVCLAKLAWGKTDEKFSLHVVPNTFSTYGIQLPDFLSYLSFHRNPCSFLSGECYSRFVNPDFDVQGFADALGSAFQEVSQAQRFLESCGYALHQPEGWGFFFGKDGGGRHSSHKYYGDAHTSGTAPKQMKKSEDEILHFHFTWIENGPREKGWTIHYIPKHPPLSVEFQSVFNFLGINQFLECPENGFNPCFWKHIQFQQHGDSPFDSNAEAAHRWFDAHSNNFSKAIKSLLTAQSIVEKFGMSFLPFVEPVARQSQEIENHTEPRTAGSSIKMGKAVGLFDVAISFAGTERTHAEELAKKVRAQGFNVFYDNFFPEMLWGKNLVEFFHEIYSKRSRYCVIFVSQEYLSREWTIHERRSAQERMLKEKGNEYILPVKVDDTELPGIPATIGYLPIATGIDNIANALITKLQSR